MIRRRPLLRALLLGPATLAAVVFVAPTPAHAEEVCGAFDTVDVNGKEYVAQNNVWGASTAQCIDVNGTSFQVTRSEHNNATNGAPASYPSIFEGCHWDNCTTNSELPLQVSEIADADTAWSVTASADGAWNAAYDLWFKTNPAPGEPDGAELMIWLDSQGGVQPAGSIVATDVPIAGATWNVWQAQMSWNYIAYQRTSPASSADFDLNEFIVDATGRGAVQPSWYLATVEAGFEIWAAGTGLATNSFSFTGSAVGDPETTERKELVGASTR
ncbi:MAG: glycoside hydrolase [Streptosporangiales bacterium]|nr:glycoside hydrolase [Streptosporangiales bacterium]